MLRSRIGAGWLAFALAGLAGAVLTGCPSGQPPGDDTGSPSSPPPGTGVSGRLQIMGSTTILPLAQEWRGPFNQQYPRVEVAISGGGSGTGITQLIARSTDIANSARDIKDQEIQMARSVGVEPVEHVIAYDAITTVVHPDNPLHEISLEQISDIFSGRVRKWEHVGGGMRGEIQVVARDSASGTYESFKEMAIQLHGEARDRDYAPHALRQQSNEAIRQLVSRSRTAIGYVGLAYADSRLKVLAVIASGGQAGVMPSAETVRDGSYPLARPMYCYTDGQPQGAVQAWLDFGLSPEGQRIVEEHGFIGVR